MILGNRPRLRLWIVRSLIGLGVLLLAALLFAGGVVFGGLKVRDMFQAANRDYGLIVSPDGIQEAGYLRIGGVRQWVTISSQDTDAPIMLMLHGGPGGALADFSYVFQRPWEDYFTVVQWDQRGYGRSSIDHEQILGTVTKERYIADAIELIDYLRRRFRQRKIVLLGQSWGTLLGLEIAHRRPDLLHAFVAVGQVTNWEQNFEGQRQNLLALARRTGDEELERRMVEVGPVPVDPNGWEEFVDWMFPVGDEMIRRGYSWRNYQGPGTSWEDRIVTSYVGSPTVDHGDLWNRFMRKNRSFRNYATLHPTVSGWDAVEDVGTDLDVPYIVIMGRYDWQTPIDRARAYFEQVCAPYKSFVEMQHSAHVVHAEEPGRFVVALVREVLPAVRGEVPEGAETCNRQGQAAPPAQ